MDTLTNDLGHCVPPEDTGTLAMRAAMNPNAPRRSKSSAWLARTGASTEPVIQSTSSIPPSKTITSRELSVRVKHFAHVSAESDCMQLTLGLLERLAPTDVAVTLMGETGTGKDVLAHAMHNRSKRCDGPFVVLDCGALAANLAESEVLGHERGAFTGAITAHAGAFERARGGTLFLDEIGELPLDLQPRLLRAIDNRHGRRVGGSKDRAFDVRIIAATNRDLRAEVAKGRFRQDLFFRIGAAIVPVPPLRDRLADLPGLLSQLLSDIEQSHLHVTEQACAVIRSHAWPGNVRELKNALACAAAFVEQGCHELDAGHFESVLMAANGRLAFDEIERLPLGGQRLERIERAAILQTLIQSDGNKVRAAETLGIAVSTLYEKLKKYRLEEEPCDVR